MGQFWIWSSLVLASMFIARGALGQTQVEGEVRGVWGTSGSPYEVVDTLYILDGDTLTVEPGVIVDFQGHYKFYVSGLLRAVGTEQDSIFFTTDTEANPDRWGGLRFYNAHRSCGIEYCRIEFGRAYGSHPHNNGGAVYCYHSDPAISNCTIVHNSAQGGGGANGGGGIYCEYSDPTITGNSIIHNSSLDEGGGICCYSSSPVIEGNTIADNTGLGRGAGIACFLSSNPRIEANRIEGNTGGLGLLGGGLYCSGSSPEIIRNLIVDNIAYQGGGIYCYQQDISRGAVRIMGNLFGNNVAGTGAALYNEGSSPLIVNNTITGNQASTTCGGVYSAAGGIPTTSSLPFVANTILYNNGGENGSQIHAAYLCTTYLSYSNVKNRDSTGVFGEIVWGSGNIDADPLFADTLRRNYRLTVYSPCVDAGSEDTSGLALPGQDIDGHPRIWDGDGDARAVVDMGAYEYGFSPQVTEEPLVALGSSGGLFVSPNPSAGAFVVEFMPPERGPVWVALYDIAGRRVRESELCLQMKQKRLVLNCARLKAGVYLLLLRGRTLRYTKKLVLLH